MVVGIAWLLHIERNSEFKRHWEDAKQQSSHSLRAFLLLLDGQNEHNWAFTGWEQHAINLAHLEFLNHHHRKKKKKVLHNEFIHCQNHLPQQLKVQLGHSVKEKEQTVMAPNYSILPWTKNRVRFLSLVPFLLLTFEINHLPICEHSIKGQLCCTTHMVEKIYCHLLYILSSTSTHHHHLTLYQQSTRTFSSSRVAVWENFP